MSDKMITTDHPLSGSQQEILIGLLDVIIPASDDGRMPSAGEIDIMAYIETHAPEFVAALIPGLDSLGAAFAALPQAGRVPLVEAFSLEQAGLFGTLLFHVYACYYQENRVLEGLGIGAGAPFPRGNTVIPGDLSLLDPVLKRPRLYRT